MRKFSKLGERYRKVTQAEDTMGRRVVCVLLSGGTSALGSIAIMYTLGFPLNPLFVIYCFIGSVAVMCLAATSSPVRAVMWGLCGAVWVFIEFLLMIILLILAPLSLLG